MERGRKAASISRSIAAISCAHETAGHLPPGKTKIVQNALASMRRTIGTTSTKKAPATADKISAMLALCPDTVKGKRDRAILSLGFAGAFRRSELVSLEVADIQMMEGGAQVTIRKSKTDQEGKGQTIGILEGTRLRPLASVQEWMSAAGIIDGIVFQRLSKAGKLLGPMSPEAVAILIKNYAAKAGLDGSQFSGHSLRAGFITSGAEAGHDAIRIAEVSRHKSLDVLRGYVRRSNLLKDHPGASFM
ncbi:phage DNA recombinase [Komagataeibacter europaeus NBRC 3261]|uniref:Phage DNA recombinase n=2 Tax=Komagataeibacter europaeus TaxID=33995 RepID=A0A0D6PZE9_KOMEU|nr:phage DNA recombinase [Komagataeibacter europaeus NBRC 3261]